MGLKNGPCWNPCPTASLGSFGTYDNAQSNFGSFMNPKGPDTQHGKCLVPIIGHTFSPHHSLHAIHITTRAQTPVTSWSQSPKQTLLGSTVLIKDSASPTSPNRAQEFPGHLVRPEGPVSLHRAAAAAPSSAPAPGGSSLWASKGFMAHSSLRSFEPTLGLMGSDPKVQRTQIWCMWACI